ncbi:MAG: alpha/beta hydrolase [Anaerolineae bacterium]|nr:alpha/beta hydrolase [Anaerolineae bacterium]
MCDNKHNNARLPLPVRLAAPFVAAAASWIAYSSFAIDHDVPLPPALDAEREELVSQRAGRLSYYVDRGGVGRPLVLIHSINAAGCAYEMKPLFEHYRGSRPVYALELPGFGFAERSDRVYSPVLYQQAIGDFLAAVVQQPADVIALSLSSEFAALAALAQPEHVASLALISPSGFTPRGDGRSSERASQGGTSNAVYRVFSVPLWAQALYDLIATQRSIYFFLGQSFVGPVDDGLAEYGYLTSHQPGARYAPLYFVSGLLFSDDIREQTYEWLTQPVLVVHDQDAFVRFDELPGVLERHPNWQRVRITPTKGLPHFEQLAATVAALDQFWAGQDA